MITKEYLQKELATRIKGIKPGVETTTDLVIGEMKSILVLVEALQDDEKKYNNALDWMRGVYPTLTGSAKKDAEHFFPELRESEDERIRRTLVEYFSPKVQLDLVRGVPIQKIRDWLEKQKEQNHDGKKWIYEDDYHKDMERAFNDGKDEVLENPEKYGLQKEQKPADYCSVRDEFDLNGNLKQKPAKWSEEDERILKGIIGKIDHDQTYGVSKAEMLSFLKSLRTQPRWKPSEEQMEALKSFLDYHRPIRNGSVQNWQEFDNLESLYEQLKKL